MNTKFELRCFDHVTRMDEGNCSKEALAFELVGRRPARRPRKTWWDVLQQNIGKLSITNEMFPVFFRKGLISNLTSLNLEEEA